MTVATLALPTQKVGRRLHDSIEQAIVCFQEAEAWARDGYGHLFSIYHEKLWLATHDSWNAFLRDFVTECRARDIFTVSVETMEQRTRDYVRLVVGLGMEMDDVLALPPRVANKIASLATWPRIGSSDYDPSIEGVLTMLDGTVRRSAITLYGAQENASDTDVLRLVVERLLEAEGAMAGLEEIARLARPDLNYTMFSFFVDHGRRTTMCNMTVYRDKQVASTWYGDISQTNTPPAVFDEYVRRLGAREVA